MPISNQLHRDKALENISVAYMPNEFIADKLVPKVPVMHESDVYYVFDQDIMALPETLRADGSQSRQATYNLSTSSYRVEEHAVNDIVTDRMRANADKALKPDVDATEILTKKILIRREVECANIAFDTANFSNNVSLAAAAAPCFFCNASRLAAYLPEASAPNDKAVFNPCSIICVFI